MGLSLVEQRGTVVVEAVLAESCIDQMNAHCSLNMHIQPGDIISTVNGAGELAAIVSQCQSLGNFTFEVIHGPYEIHPTMQPDSGDEMEAVRPNLKVEVETEVERNNNEARQQSMQARQEQASQLVNDRRRLVECTGPQDLQKVLAERIALIMCRLCIRGPSHAVCARQLINPSAVRMVSGS